ncbi:hypothetical protein [Massilia glaciei]|uniref:hypothetical protein n=1 Tax=Massilia glaciei TaxID=1524097 RepID=UPI000D6467D6|nr:hypothetical protein [Massilia glaciei]
MLRMIGILLVPVLLAGCIRDGKTHYVEGREHSLTVRAEQEYFWKDEVTLTFVASRTPECTRVFPMTKVPRAEVALTLHTLGNDVWNVRLGERTWQFETQGCTQRAGPPKDALGDLVGTFTLRDKKLVYQPAKPAAL